MKRKQQSTRPVLFGSTSSSMSIGWKSWLARWALQQPWRGSSPVCCSPLRGSPLSGCPGPLAQLPGHLMRLKRLAEASQRRQHQSAQSNPPQRTRHRGRLSNSRGSILRGPLSAENPQLVSRRQRPPQPWRRSGTCLRSQTPRPRSVTPRRPPTPLNHNDRPYD